MFIDSNNIQKYVVFDAKFSSGTFNDPSNRLIQYLEQFGKESTGILGFNKILRFREGILEIGETVAVLGEGRWKDAHEPDLPESFGRVLYIQATKEMPIFLSDCIETKEKIRFPEERKKELKRRYRK